MTIVRPASITRAVLESRRVSSVESGHRTRATRLLVVTAAIELGAGLTLLAVPAVVIRLLFGSAADVHAAVGVARVTGVALISLGTACWSARHQERSAASTGLVAAMFIYNVGVAALALAGALGAVGPVQWAAAGAHGTLAIWCARVVGDRRG